MRSLLHPKESLANPRVLHICGPCRARALAHVFPGNLIRRPAPAKPVIALVRGGYYAATTWVNFKKENPMVVQLTGYLDVPDARLPAVLNALDAHIRLSRAEPGCISFDVRPDPQCPTRLLVAEAFTDQASFDAHQARTAASPWARISAGIARTYQITTDTPL